MTAPLSAREAYRDWAAIYDSDENRTRDLDALVLRAAPLALDGAHVIEIGAGTGKNTVWLAGRAARVTALDLSCEMLDRARARGLGDHVAFHEQDIARPWPVADGAADFVIGNLVLEHVPELAPVLDEAARVLRPGGTLYLSELHPYRQLRGSQARFDQGGTERRVEAYVRSVSDFVGAALAAGFTLAGMTEAIEEGRTPSAQTPPRLLVLRFTR